MEHYIEVMERILELLETIKEGLARMKNQLLDLRYEEAFIILQDSMEGIASIERAILPMQGKLSKNKIDSLTAGVKESINRAVTSYEQAKEINLKNQVEEELLPVFENWKEEINRVLRTYMVS